MVLQVIEERGIGKERLNAIERMIITYEGKEPETKERLEWTAHGVKWVNNYVDNLELEQGGRQPGAIERACPGVDKIIEM